MKHIGHIELRDSGVIFVYHELPEPRLNDYYLIFGRNKSTFKKYKLAIKEYNASRREAKVSNVHFKVKSKTAIVIEKLEDRYPIEVKHNQPCEAEVKDNKAVIIKIL